MVEWSTIETSCLKVRNDSRFGDGKESMNVGWIGKEEWQKSDVVDERPADTMKGTIMGTIHYYRAEHPGE